MQVFCDELRGKSENHAQCLDAIADTVQGIDFERWCWALSCASWHGKAPMVKVLMDRG